MLRDAGRLAGIPGALIHGRLARAWPDAQLFVIDEAGHLGNDRTRARVRDALDRFACQ